MDLGAKRRGGAVTLTTFILVLAPACAQGVGLDDSGGPVTVAATGTGTTPTDTSASATEPDSSTGEPDDTGSSAATSTGGESSSSSGGEESSSGGDGTTGDDLPQAELYPFDRVHSPISVAVADAMRVIATTADKNPGVFTRVGGSISASPDFHKCFADDPAIQGLPAEPTLVTTISHFRMVDLGGSNSWNHVGAAAMAGWNSDMLATGMPTPVGTEITAILPRFAHVLLGTHDLEKDTPEALWAFADNLLDVVDELSDGGVVPVLSTIPVRGDKPAAALLVPRFNGVIRAVAQGRQIPLLDLNLAIGKLPMQGLAAGGVDLSVFASAGENRPCYFSEAALQFGYNVHNLESLRALDRARQVVVDVAPSLDDPGPMLLGTGTAADPIRIPSLPFVDLRSTGDSPSDIIDNYGGACDVAVDESGPERFYRLEIAAPVTVRAMVFDRDPVNVDLHVLTGVGPDTCIKRHEQEIAGPLPPGTYYLAVDSNGGMVPGGAAGEYALVILLE